MNQTNKTTTNTNVMHTSKTTTQTHTNTHKNNTKETDIRQRKHTHKRKQVHINAVSPVVWGGAQRPTQKKKQKKMLVFFT